MTIKTIILIISLIAVGAGIFVFTKQPQSSQQPASNQPSAIKNKNITVYLSPTCGCCKNYLAYLRSAGFVVDARETNNMADVKKEYKIPGELESCHTSVIDNYVAEGHIPFEVIDKLLAEKPDIKGIALAQMPSGSPGMPGKKNASFSIHSVTTDGLDGGVYQEY